jgi:tetratricopeptide (TPR) repeat protein
MRARVASPIMAAFFLLAVTVSAARADPVKGTVTLTKEDNFARLVVQLGEDIESDVRTSGSILIVRFKKQVDVPVHRLPDQYPDYIASARRDPDGMALRFALGRKVKINVMAAGERLFVDLLPENWNGVPPGLPQEVVQELAERARTAERLLRQQKQEEARKRAPIRVRASTMPTFVRYVFELPDGVGVSSDLGRDKLALVFNADLLFDLADAKVVAPSNIASIEQRTEAGKTTVELSLIGEVNVHSFREERNYIVDVGVQGSDKNAQKELPLTRDALRAAMKKKPASAASEAAKGKPEPAPQAEAPRAEAASAPEAKSEGQALSTPPAAKVEAPSAPGTSAAEIESRIAASVPPVPAPLPPPVETLARSDPSASAKHEPAAVVKGVEAPPPVSVPVSAPALAATSAAKPEPVKQDPPVAVAPSRPMAAAIDVEARKDSDGLKIVFPFRTATAAAAFRSADAVWLVFDSEEALNLDAIRPQTAAPAREAAAIKLDGGVAVRIRIDRPQLAGLSATGTSWTLVLGDIISAPSQQLTVARNIADAAHANVTIPFDQPSRRHRLVDPEAGNALIVVTAPAPIRSFVKGQKFVEFRLPDAVHGVVVEPLSDDIAVELSGDKITIGRPGGLTLSAAEMAPQRAAAPMRPIFDLGLWKDNRSANFTDRLHHLQHQVATAADDARIAARLELARFYLAHEMFHEAKAILDIAVAEMKPGAEDTKVLVPRAVANILSGYVAEGLKDLAHPAVGNNYDSQLWKAIAFARQGKWSEAREKFKNVEFSISALPIEIQRIAVTDALRAALEVRDYASASNRLNEIEVVGSVGSAKASIAVLRGRLAEALGKEADAQIEYAEAMKSGNRAAESEAVLRDVALRLKRGDIKPKDALAQLETLSMTWRGDAVEVEALWHLSRLYAGEGRFRDAFLAVKMATKIAPNSVHSRQMQDDATRWFADLFLGGKGDDLPPVEALAMFYEFRELTPIGRRGDDMIRRLADRLAAIELLDQACELLQYQVDHRLEGAARAQVATRLATFYLMNHKPDRAVAALRATRIAELAGELRQQRLLLEARAQSDLGRHDLALDIIANAPGREAIRLRSDIHWAARRWRDSAEQIELLYGEL